MLNHCSFTDACTNWAPAVDAGLTFVEALVEPGDFQGKHADSAYYFCLYSRVKLTNHNSAEAKLVCVGVPTSTLEPC
jgi:hypothetical protein